MSIERYSSRREALGPVLTARLADASRYLRIDAWIEAVLRDRTAVRNFSQRVEMTKPPMVLRYKQDMDDRGLDWEYTERVLSSRDLDEWMRQGW
jgi:hypothetical protein